MTRVHRALGSLGVRWVGDGKVPLLPLQPGTEGMIEWMVGVGGGAVGRMVGRTSGGGLILLRCMMGALNVEVPLD